MTDGIASVSIGGQSVQAYTLDALRGLRNEIKGELALANASSFAGMRVRKTIPPAAG